MLPRLTGGASGGSSSWGRENCCGSRAITQAYRSWSSSWARASSTSLRAAMETSRVTGMPMLFRYASTRLRICSHCVWPIAVCPWFCRSVFDQNVVVRRQTVGPGFGQGAVAFLQVGAQIQRFARGRLGQHRQAPEILACIVLDKIFQHFGAIQAGYHAFHRRTGFELVQARAGEVGNQADGAFLLAAADDIAVTREGVDGVAGVLVRQFLAAEAEVVADMVRLVGSGCRDRTPEC